MLVILMRNDLKGRIMSKGIFFCFGKDYVRMTRLVQADKFGRSVSERQKGCHVRRRCWIDTEATVTGGIDNL